jgi:hypothetical protein
MDRSERQLTSVSSLLTHAGRLQLVNSVLSSLPTYTMCSVMVPMEVHENLDRAQRHCMWTKSESNARSKPLVAWRKCTRPERKGGLGVVNLKSQNVVLLLKHLDKFYNKKDIPWVKLIWDTYYPNGEVPHSSGPKGSFWRKDILKLCDTFRGIASCKVGSGDTILFWSGTWNDMVMQYKFPRLFSYAKNKNISVAQFLINNQLHEQFHLPLSVEAFQEYQQMQQIIQQIQISSQNKDTWHYIWGNNRYTSAKFYHFPYRNIQPPPPFIWIWDSKCSNKLRVFVWLLLMDRLDVRNILKRKKHRLQDNNYSCPICSAGVEETTFHLFFTCSSVYNAGTILGFTGTLIFPSI